MNFQTLPLKNDYRPKSQNPPEKFFRRVLPLTDLYRRASGYFTSSVFSLFSEEIIEFNDLKVYSDFGLSNNLFLFCVNILTFVQDRKITVRVLTLRDIFISPRGKLIDFFP